MNLRAYPRIRSVVLKSTDLYWRTREKYVHNYVFIHINKNGGRSVEQALGSTYEHKTALQKIGELGQARWDRKFTFGFVRNPWDRVVSQYAYRLQTRQDGLGDEAISFEEWVRARYSEHTQADRGRALMFAPQHVWLEDPSGTVLVDFIGRFEQFEDDFRYVCEQIGRKASLPHANRSGRRDYRDYYTEETQAIIAAYFQGDIERYGYTFD